MVLLDGWEEIWGQRKEERKNPETPNKETKSQT